MKDLKNQNVLFITPKFFSYENLIEKKIKERGGCVYKIYENLDEISFFYRFIYVYLKLIKHKVLVHYYLRKIKQLPEQIDIVFVIRGSSLSPEVLHFLHTKYGNAYFVMYQWDSIANNKNSKVIAKYFNKCLTFDKKDAEHEGWVYRPLFFAETSFFNLKEKDIDVSYICSIHSERIQILNALIGICKNKQLNLFTHVFSKRLIFYKHKYFDKKKEYLLADNKYIKFYPITTEQLFNIYARSKIIVDYTNPNQEGLTMRTVECLGNHCKLITNNQNLKEVDFYEKNNYFIYDGIDLTIPSYILETPYNEVDNSIYNYYSLDGWLDSIFSNDI